MNSQDIEKRLEEAEAKALVALAVGLWACKMTSSGPPHPENVANELQRVAEKFGIMGVVLERAEKLAREITRPE